MKDRRKAVRVWQATDLRAVVDLARVQSGAVLDVRCLDLALLLCLVPRFNDLERLHVKAVLALSCSKA